MAAAAAAALKLRFSNVDAGGGERSFLSNNKKKQKTWSSLLSSARLPEFKCPLFCFVFSGFYVLVPRTSHIPQIHIEPCEGTGRTNYGQQ